MRRAINLLLKNFGYMIIKLEDSVREKRLYLSEKLNHEFGGEVKYGPFEGLKFCKDSWWGATDRANMLLRLYEQELLTQL